MGKYRKKPVVIEAYQWEGQDVPGYNQTLVYTDPNIPGSRVLLIPTLEGTMQASMGDYIITGVKGEVYPCKPDIFAATHEPEINLKSSTKQVGLLPLDWDYICEQLIPFEDDSEDIVETKHSLSESIQYQLGNRSFSSNKG